MTTIYEVLRRPLVTEKTSYQTGKHNQYTFEVADDATKPEVPPVPSGKPAESGGAKPAPPADPGSKPAEPGEQASPIKDASPEGQVQEEVKKLFEPFKPQERLGW